MDEFSRSGLALDLEYSFPGRSVVAVLDRLAGTYGYPKYLRVDNGTELTSKVMQQWGEDHCVELLFIQPGKPTQNAYIESFNSRVRSEFLNAHWFRSLVDARTAADAWRRSYNSSHAHSVSATARPRSSSRPTKLRQPHRYHWPHNGSGPLAIAFGTDRAEISCNQGNVAS